MKRLLLVLATGFGLDGCASLTQKADENYITKSPVTPVNTAFNGTANSNMRCDSFKSHMIINKLSKFL
ncbi:hypothetical protein CLM70_09930 [Acinetobacter baumannii]|nr:hypothetical protein CLM70_09930 [Acinetobacter baumannii]